ncbi:MAG: stalk domain-containing protein [Clostridia bacterium]|nr:stalk domain-containing protein [Clostridia bacterium]
MKDKLKGIVLGIVIGVMLVPTAFAAIGTVTKDLSYDDIKISLNGKIIEPKDANGNKIEPFIIEGTTYLPVRAVGDALGLNVEWEATSKTVLLTDSSKSISTTGKVVYEKGGIKITYVGIKQEDSFIDFKFLIENNASNGITVQTRDESINGYMMSGIMSEDVQPGKKANGALTYYNSMLEENGIDNIDELEFSFHIFDEETWDTIDDSNIIKINP